METKGGLRDASPHIAMLLVGPENSDNIGAAARAMKNMGFYGLRLVSPPKLWRKKAKKMAVSAGDVVDAAKIYRKTTLAIADAGLVIGTTRRGGPARGHFVPFHKAINEGLRRASGKPTVFMFGCESKGLDNENLRLCDWVTTIPVHEGYPSVNLAQAVMLIAFNLFDRMFQNADITQYRRTSQAPKRGKAGRRNSEAGSGVSQDYLDKAALFELLDRLEAVLNALEYQTRGGGLIARIRNTFYGLSKRNGLLVSEAQMFRGIFRRILESLADKPVCKKYKGRALRPGGTFQEPNVWMK